MEGYGDTDSLASDVEETRLVGEPHTQVSDIKVYDVAQHNILLLGESRTGKSTYRKVLHNINHVTKLEVWRGTVVPNSSTSLFNVDGKFVSLNILDTPGFGEASVSSTRTDSNLQNIIVEFVKKDITELSLILITVNGSGGLTSSQIKKITNCLRFLGRRVAKKTCLLVTHFENRNRLDEKKWIDEFKSNKRMRFLTRACQGGFLFTGALDDSQFKNVTCRDKFIDQQRRRNKHMFEKLLAGSPVKLMSQQMKEAKSMFAIEESIITSCMNLQAMIPEVESTWNHALNARVKINKYLSDGKVTDKELVEHAKKVTTKLACIGTKTDDIKTMKLDENVVKFMTEYEKIGSEIKEKYRKTLELLNKYSEMDQEASLLLNELEWST